MTRETPSKGMNQVDPLTKYIEGLESGIERRDKTIAALRARLDAALEKVGRLERSIEDHNRTYHHRLESR